MTTYTRIYLQLLSILTRYNHHETSNNTCKSRTPQETNTHSRLIIQHKQLYKSSQSTSHETSITSFALRSGYTPSLLALSSMVAEVRVPNQKRVDIVVNVCEHLLDSASRSGRAPKYGPIHQHCRLPHSLGHNSTNN